MLISQRNFKLYIIFLTSLSEAVVLAPPDSVLTVTGDSFSLTTFTESAQFGAILPIGTDGLEPQDLFLSDAISLDDPYLCGPLPATPVFTGPTAILVSRGNCSFFYKAQFAAYAGATTVLVYNGLPGMYLNANLSGTQQYSHVGSCETDCSAYSGSVTALQAADINARDSGFTDSCGATCGSGLCALTNKVPDSLTGSRQICCVVNDLLVMGYGDADLPEDPNDPVYSIGAAFVSAGDGAKLSATLQSSSTLSSVPLSVFLSLRPIPFMDVGSILLWLLGTATIGIASWISAYDEREDFIDRVEGIDLDDNDSNLQTTTDNQRFSSRRLQRLEARRKRKQLKELMSRGGAESQQVTLSPRQSMYLLAFSAVFLLILYFLLQFGKVVVYLIMIVFSVGSISALSTLIFSPLIGLSSTKLSPALLSLPSLSLPFKLGTFTAVEVFSSFLSFLVVLAWFLTRNLSGSYVLQDFLAILICCVFLKQVRVTTLRTASLVLAAFFSYDVFMVFLTPFIFGSSVMVDVATAGQPQQVTNPACYCRLNPSDDNVCGVGEVMPILLRLPRMNDYRGGFSMLGLGDIVLPGLLLSYALRTDYELARGLHPRASSDANERIYPSDGAMNTQLPHLTANSGISSPSLVQRGPNSSFTSNTLSQESSITSSSNAISLNSSLLSTLAKYGIILDGLWIIALVGYAIGLIFANFAVALFQMGQPALLYLVPCTVIPICAMSIFRGDFDALWRGREVDSGEITQHLIDENSAGSYGEEGGVLVEMPTENESSPPNIHPALAYNNNNNNPSL